jgi:hypothetical protein
MVEYNRYLKEIVTALESDAEFKTKLEKAEESDIRVCYKCDLLLTKNSDERLFGLTVC